MATGYVTCQSCGDATKIRTAKNRRDTDSYCSWLESKGYLCDDCSSKARDAENVKAAKENADAGLPALTGSEKQVAWAETIRKALTVKAQEILDEAVKQSNKEDVALAVKIMERFCEKSRASWWIDHRNANPEDLLINIQKEIEAEEDRGENSMDAVEAKAEATLRPEGEVTPVVAEIKEDGSTIIIDMPEKVEAFRVVMRNLGYRWSGSDWRRTLRPWNGAVEDRMAEAGNKIVAAGIPVRIYDAAIRAAAVDANFEPEHKRWLKCMNGGQHKGKIAISWPYGEDYYQRAKAIPGARYSKPDVVVAVEHYEALLDFADAYDFRLTSGAQQAIEAARIAHDHAIIAKPEDAPEAPSGAAGTMPAPTGEIDDDLRDH